MVEHPSSKGRREGGLEVLYIRGASHLRGTSLSLNPPQPALLRMNPTCMGVPAERLFGFGLEIPHGSRTAHLAGVSCVVCREVEIEGYAGIVEDKRGEFAEISHHKKSLGDAADSAGVKLESSVICVGVPLRLFSVSKCVNRVPQG
uniref:Uncharacterized protein n=1 Tax=Cacopsylla melanoneura TaxID=428564 RepID=A0A8D8M409_9HEMI